jgi:hypothetical protein
MFLGCKKSDSKTSITISSISDITATGVTIIGDLVIDNSVSVISKGICWSKLPKPVYADAKISIGKEPGSFTGIITGLDVSTKYYVRAYVVTNLGTIYGNELSFTTEEKFKKIAEKVKPLFDEYNEKREDIRLDHAFEDKSGVLELNDKGEYKFTKEGIKAMAKDMKALLDETFEFYAFTFSTEGIDDLKFLAEWVEGIEPEQPNEDEQV